MTLVAQMVKCLSTMQETWVQALSWEDSPEEGNGNSLQYSCLENPMDRGAWWAIVHKVTNSWIRLSDFTYFHFHFNGVSKSLRLHGVEFSLLYSRSLFVTYFLTFFLLKLSPRTLLISNLDDCRQLFIYLRLFYSHNFEIHLEWIPSPLFLLFHGYLILAYHLHFA